MIEIYIFFLEKKRKISLGPTEIWTRIAGFKVQSANHYTMGPADVEPELNTNFVGNEDTFTLWKQISSRFSTKIAFFSLSERIKFLFWQFYLH